jgi:hypothetical protein
MQSKFCNEVINMKNIKSQRGFILIVALIACMILAALGVLVVSLSTGDQKTSSATFGEKKASAAVEGGFHKLTLSFTPPSAVDCNLASVLNTWQNVDSVHAPGTQYNISNCGGTPYGPLSPPGFPQDIGMATFDLQLTGRDTTYNSQMSVNAGLGYGPVRIDTTHF